MVILEETDAYRLVANNGFVWIEYPNGSENVLTDEEADEAWEAYWESEDQLERARERLQKR